MDYSTSGSSSSDRTTILLSKASNTKTLKLLTPKYSNSEKSMTENSVKIVGAAPLVNMQFYQPEINEIIKSRTSDYIVKSKLGSGTFGIVMKCFDKSRNHTVAVKILRNHPIYYRQGQKEANNLLKLDKAKGSKYNIVKFYERFLYKNHTCLVFELLGVDLFEYVMKGKRRLPLKIIRPIIYQVLMALAKLKDVGIIHSDIKPDNIVFAKHPPESYQVKLIDFGCCIPTDLACTRSRAYVQPMSYRAPEIFLGLPFNEGIDMWALGCVAIELFLGTNLFHGCTEFDIVSAIVAFFGNPSKRSLDTARRTAKFFVRHTTGYFLKSRQQYEVEFGYRCKSYQKHTCACLNSLALYELADNLRGDAFRVEIYDRKSFIDFLRELMSLNLEKDRITPRTAVTREFFTMTHLSELSQCAEVMVSKELMKICIDVQEKDDNVPNVPLVKETVPKQKKTSTDDDDEEEEAEGTENKENFPDDNKKSTTDKKTSFADKEKNSACKYKTIDNNKKTNGYLKKSTQPKEAVDHSKNSDTTTTKTSTSAFSHKRKPSSSESTAGIRHIVIKKIKK